MPTYDIPDSQAFGPFCHRSNMQRGIVHKAAYDLLMAPYGQQEVSR